MTKESPPARTEGAMHCGNGQALPSNPERPAHASKERPKGRQSMNVYRVPAASSPEPRPSRGDVLYLRPRPHAGAFLAPSSFRWLQRLLFPPLNDDDLTNDEPTETGTSEKSSINTASNIANAAGSKGPWNHPELDRSPDYVLATLRETKHMIASLQEKEKRLKSEVAPAARTGQA